jgi:hypothetical protein
MTRRTLLRSALASLFAPVVVPAAASALAAIPPTPAGAVKWSMTPFIASSRTLIDPKYGTVYEDVIGYDCKFDFSTVVREWGIDGPGVFRVEVTQDRPLRAAIDEAVAGRGLSPKSAAQIKEFVCRSFGVA